MMVILDHDWTHNKQIENDDDFRSYDWTHNIIILSKMVAINLIL